jgi:hypothetical protein
MKSTKFLHGTPEILRIGVTVGEVDVGDVEVGNGDKRKLGK